MTKLATICYIDNGKELLLLHRNKKPNDVHEGKWISVGGKLEAGETPDECARREILEETHSDNHDSPFLVPDGSGTKYLTLDKSSK